MEQLVPYAQVLGLSGASALAAYVASFSHYGVPTVSLASGTSDLIVKQWSRMFNKGYAVAPPLAGGVALCFSLVAYYTRDTTKRTLFTLAATLPLCFPIYTRLFMWDGIQALEAAAAGTAGAPSGAQIKSLIATWDSQNVNRALMAATAAICGAVATVL